MMFHVKLIIALMLLGCVLSLPNNERPTSGTSATTSKPITTTQRVSNKNATDAAVISSTAVTPTAELCQTRCMSQYECDQQENPLFSDDTCAFIPERCLIKRACTSGEVCCQKFPKG